MSQVTEELLFLYELSLNLGQSLDPGETARHFLKTLLSRRNLSAASIWWREERSEHATQQELATELKLLDAIPRGQYQQASLPLTPALIARMQSGQAWVWSTRAQEVAQLATHVADSAATCAFFPLGEEGLLLLESSDDCQFSPRFLGQLRAVVSNLGNTLRGAKAHALLRARTALLDESRRLLQTVIDTVPLRVFWKDRECRYLGCNPAFAHDAGKDCPADLIGLDDYQMSWAPEANLCRADDQRIMETGKPRLNFEEPSTTSDGRQIWLRSSKIPLYDLHGEVMGVLGVYVDITEQKREERRLALAMDASNIMVWELDFTTGKLGYDGSTLPALGLEDPETPYTLESWLTRVHPDDQGPFSAMVEQSLQPDDTRGLNLEYRFRDNAGNYLWLQTVGRVAHRNHAGQALLGAGYTINIDERKRATAELERHRQHLEELVLERTADLVNAIAAAEAASQAKSTFLANMSHELRTPMNGVMGMIDMAKRRMTDPVGLNQLDKAKLASERLLSILNDILDLSKIEAEHLVLEVHRMQLVDTVDTLRATLDHKAVGKDIDLAIDLPSDLAHLHLVGDPLRLGQILINLIGNAIKFTDHGKVILRARQVGETSAAVKIRFDVTDTGIGIAPEVLARLFQNFEQADNSMTRKYGGTGLGLAISKRLVLLMGGEIGVESTLGQGSNFWFVVSLEKQAQTGLPPTQNSACPTAEQRLLAEYSCQRVLLAEDEPVTQDISRFLLEDVGFVVDVADDGRQALDLARRNTYALILMDMQMPVMNGIQATQAIRADSINKTTPILATTANAFDNDRHACLEAGMNEHIPKPINRQNLYETMLAWLERRSNRSPV